MENTTCSLAEFGTHEEDGRNHKILLRIETKNQSLETMAGNF
jgi:hypothetical protein